MTNNSSNATLVSGFMYVGGLFTLQFIISIMQIGLLDIVSFAIFCFAVYLLYRVTANYRDEHCDGVISYGNAFWLIFQMYFIASVISAIIMFIYFNFINKDFLIESLDRIMKMYEQFNLPVDYDMVEGFFKPIPYVLLNLFGSIFASAFWAAIVAAFVKKSKSIFVEN